MYMGSADWMPRNLERRVEILFPVLNPELKEKVWHILDVQMRDTVKAGITFGTIGAASAPGQFPIGELRSLLDALHEKNEEDELKQ